MRTLPVPGRWSGGAGARIALITGLLAIVSYLDHLASGRLPISHLYYLPILLGAISFGYVGGLGSAVAAIGLYHLTHFVLPGPAVPLDEADLLRLVLFLAVGVTTAKLSNDRRRMSRLARELEMGNRELSALNSQLTELSQARADFVAVASHELRTPLTAILGSAALLVDRPTIDPERRSKLLRHIHDAAARLQNTVESLLDAALIESGRFSLRREPVAVAQVLEDCRQAFLAIGEERINVVNPPPGLAFSVDRHKLLQVLINLVGNAFKYSPPGTPVDICAAPDCEGVKISVTDCGYGIEPADLSYIFERYYRAADGRIRANRGAGLGLSVSRDIVRAHGGDLSVRSRLGEGSTFTVVIPAPMEPPREVCTPAGQKSDPHL